MNTIAKFAVGALALAVSGTFAHASDDLLVRDVELVRSEGIA